MEHVHKSTCPANINLFKINNRNTRKECEISSNWTMKTPERLQWCPFGDFTINFEHISHLFLMFLLLTLDKWTLVESRVIFSCEYMCAQLRRNWNDFINFKMKAFIKVWSLSFVLLILYQQYLKTFRGVFKTFFKCMWWSSFCEKS